MKITIYKDGSGFRINQDNGEKQQSLKPSDLLNLLYDKHGPITFDVDSCTMCKAAEKEVSAAKSCISGILISNFE